ncbi:hypothetical protein KMZ32_02885 [Phycicoccus sp. MAQZ13P-2]|uniref:hypothetical protein n=1 Tax=Phycicoccus mangrovi TaxID=2840470 RepID=UPI001C003A47|nr:hypothetical protein [Phycicoccus mangrovi]MBT9254776.1 hypothetical protein [Phycicoccus mangrovi]MBT9273019.1 hypothetical protein [Phycicoccus mangrovi]
MTAQRTALGGGTTLVLAGLVTFWLSRVVDSGFVHGLFQGMTVALMVLGAATIGSGLWGRASGGDRLWLPSRDRDA